MNHGTKRLEPVRKFLREHWTLLTDAEIAHVFGMSRNALRRLRYRMGLKRLEDSHYAAQNSKVAVAGGTKETAGAPLSGREEVLPSVEEDVSSNSAPSPEGPGSL